MKALLALEHFAQLQPQDILDVWDRQYLNKQYQKTKPEHADMFSVVLRIPLKQADHLMSQSSFEGVYFEPRSQSGRAPSPSHRIVWLPKKSFADVIAAKQATTEPATIARAGDRFGLRVAASDAPAVHHQHRPDIAYLDGSATKQYHISPLPFGTTKQSLQQVFKTWEWNARVSHTQGLTADKQGLVWVAIATESPKFWVFTMQHGDVLISEHNQPKPSRPQQVGAPVASSKTLRSLNSSASASKNHAEYPAQDPWLIQDPWTSAYKAQTKQSTPSAGQLATLEANVQKKVIATLQEQMAHSKSADADMDHQQVDRVSTLEHQVSMLTSNVQQLTGSLAEFKHQQTSHNNQVAHQVQTLKQQADQQQHTMQSLLEQKMEEQMNKIEALLTNKRPKTGNE